LLFYEHLRSPPRTSFYSAGETLRIVQVHGSTTRANLIQQLFMSHVLPLHQAETVPRLELDGGWDFVEDRTGRLRYADLGKVTTWRPARAGLSWNVQFDDLRDYMGAAWYRTRIQVPSFGDTRHALLKFGAVDYFCEVFINGVLLGSHEGGYTPFSFDITAALHPGENEIAVRVVDPPMNEAENRELFPDMMYNEIPHGKQSWYVQNSGIWQGVRVEFCPALFVDRVDITPSFDGSFLAAIRLAGAGFTNEQIVRETKITITISETSGRIVYQHTQPVEHQSICEIRGVVPQRRAWSPDSPTLYVAEVSLSGAVTYRRRVRFGFRQFDARDGKFFLNGKPYYMIATLDQDFYPETIHSPASEEIVRDMMLKAKKLGVNMLRCHLKVAHPVYLDMADEIGLLVWAEMPSWSDSWFPSDHFSMRAALRGEHMFDEIMQRDWNHPSIVIRTIINESWGINLKDSEQRKWLVDAFDRVKDHLRPLNRLVVDNSACEGNFHLKTDIDDYHMYYSMPDQVRQWDKWLAEFAARPDWSFSPHGDAQRTGKEPLLVSEFGNWGLPTLPENETLPWWFEYSFGGRVVTSPAGVFLRFKEYDLNSVFRSYNDFAEESQIHQFISIKYEIESIRAQTSIEGYVLTAMTDVHWEVNGLLDMWRNPKVFSKELENIQQPDIAFGRTSKFTAFPGDEISVDLFVSHYSDRDLKNARLRWSTESGAHGSIAIANVTPGTAAKVGNAQWIAPQAASPTLERVWLELRTSNGMRIAENYLDLYVVPKIESSRQGVILSDSVRAAIPALANTTASADRDSVLIASRWGASIEDHLARGGAAIMLVNSEDALPEHFAVRTKFRAGNEYDGRWFSNFNWIRPDHPVFQPIAFGRILGFESAAIVPDYVLTDIPASNFNDVLCGVTYGWLQLNSAMIMQAKLGPGRLILTTFRFEEYGKDAYATTLLDSLISYAGSERCQPALELGEVQAK
jgi:hypothetical protein